MTSVSPPVTVTVTAVDVSQSPPLCHSPLQQLSDEHRDLISLLVAYQDKYDLPTDDDVRRVSVGLRLRLTFSCHIMSEIKVNNRSY